MSASKNVVIRTTTLNPKIDYNNKGDVWEWFADVGIIQEPSKNVIKDYSYINGLHRGEDIAVIGSGYSGREVNREKLKNMITIGVNHTIDFYVPDYLLFQDHRFLRLNKYPLETYPGTIFTANNNPFRARSKHPRIISFKPIHKGNTYSRDINNGLYSRVSSGICALNLALIMGARKVYLIGCDAPKDFDKRDFTQGVHISENYAGGIETKEAVIGYNKSIPLYKAFQGESKRIVNVCENGLNPYFQQISMDQFNNILDK